MPRQKSRIRNSLPASPQAIRLNKALAAAGLGSRRQVEELIVQGRVEIDGQTVTDLSSRVDPLAAKIKVDGELLKRPRLVYFILNKPKGVLSTNNDPSGRPRVVDYVPDRHRVFSVGRLDLHSEGVVLLTNDGTLAQRLAHPRFRVQKTYFVVVAGVMTLEELNQLRKGVYLAEGVARIDGARIRKTRKTCTELEIQLSEGKNREIRRILARAGHKVVLLRRISIGPLRLGELPVGAARELTEKEVQSLYSSTSTSQKKAKTAVESSTDAADTPQSKGERVRVSASQRKTQGDQRSQVYAGSISTQLDQPFDDDFGLGLEENSLHDDLPASTEFEFDEKNVNASEEYLGNDSELSDDDEWDDDFAIDLSMGGRTGSVIGDEEDSSESKFKRKRNQRGNSVRSPQSGERTVASRPGKRSSRISVTPGKTGKPKSLNRPSPSRSNSPAPAKKSSGQKSKGTQRLGTSTTKTSRSQQTRESGKANAQGKTGLHIKPGSRNKPGSKSKLSSGGSRGGKPGMQGGTSKGVTARRASNRTSGKKRSR